MLDENEKAALAIVVSRPCPSEMIPVTLRAALRKLEGKGLIWCKYGNWTPSDEGIEVHRRS